MYPVPWLAASYIPDRSSTTLSAFLFRSCRIPFSSPVSVLSSVTPARKVITSWKRRMAFVASSPVMVSIASSRFCKRCISSGASSRSVIVFSIRWLPVIDPIAIFIAVIALSVIWSVLTCSSSFSRKYCITRATIWLVTLSGSVAVFISVISPAIKFLVSDIIFILIKLFAKYRCKYTRAACAVLRA